jgi:hypothetical protein
MSPPSAGQFVRACRRELRFLVKDYGFTAGPLVLSGNLVPFGACFQGPKLAISVLGIQWGDAIDVYLIAGGVETQPEWAAEMERMRLALAGESPPGETPAMVRRRLDELRLRVELPAHWLFDQRLPGWRSRSTGTGQLNEIRDYAAALRSCAGDLLSGDLSALPGLFASYAEHRRQQDLRDRQEMSERLAQDLVREAQRPRTALEQVEIVEKAQISIRHVHTESRLLLKALGKSSEAASLTRFAESWRSLAERLEAEISAFAYLRDLKASAGIVQGLQNAQETATRVQQTLASGPADSALIEKITALEPLCQGLNPALEALSGALRDELPTRPTTIPY